MEGLFTEMGLGLELGLFGVLTVDIRPQGVRNTMFIVFGLFCQVFSLVSKIIFLCLPLVIIS